MQADAEPRMPAGDLRGGGGVRLGNHEARVRERTGGVVTLDGGVDFGAAAKVIAREDQGFQNAGHADMLPAHDRAARQLSPRVTPRARCPHRAP